VPLTMPSGLPPVVGEGKYTDMSAAKPAAHATLEDWYSEEPEGYTNAASEIERIEGWLAYRWGCPGILKGGAAPVVTGSYQDVHPFGLGVASVASDDYVLPVGSPSAGLPVITATGLALTSPDELLLKVGTNGKLRWAIEGSGHGLGVRAGPDTAVYAVGSKVAGSDVVAKRLLDLGGNVVETGDDTWQLEESLGAPLDAPIPGLAVDGSGTLYWPRENQAFSILVTFDSAPADLDVFFSVGPTGETHGYIFQTTLSAVSGSTSVLLGATQEESLTNLVVAINKTGNPDTQYLIDPVRDEANPYWKASHESDGTDSALRVKRIGPFGATRFSIPNTTSYTFTEVPLGTYFVASGTQAVVPANPAPRIEARSAEAGALLWSKTFDSGSQPAKPLAVAFDPNLPLYPKDDPREGLVENLYIAVRNAASIDPPASEGDVGRTLFKYSQLRRRQVIDEGLAPRRTVNLAIAGGGLYLLERGEEPALINGGASLFQADSPFAKLFTYQQKIYGLDGQNYVRYDPRLNRVEEWKAEGAGEIPFGAKLACVWNGRIVLSRTADDPHNLHMSARGNPDDWNTTPVVVTALSAFSGTAAGSLHFRKRDLVNALIPASDDLLLIGGDTSISRLTGDPGSGGELDLLTEREGVAFGDAWCMSPEGSIFLKGINGGIYLVAPTGGLTRISVGWVERRLQDINLLEYDVQMQWNSRQDGLHVFQVPKAVGGRIVEHWFWDSREAGWWQDGFAATGIQPTCSAIFDGDDPGDRLLVMGCEDGQVRYEDAAALDDGGHRIHSEVVLGPFNMQTYEGRLAFSHLEVVLASEYSGCRVQLYADDVADFQGGTEPVWEGFARPGYRGYLMARARGNEVWVKLLNAAEGETWALETLAARAYQAGEARRTH